MRELVKQSIDQGKNVFTNKTLRAEDLNFLNRLIETDVHQTCTQFLSNRSINPVTNRSIKEGNFIHSFLSSLCTQGKPKSAQQQSYNKSNNDNERKYEVPPDFKEFQVYVKQALNDYKANANKTKAKLQSLEGLNNNVQRIKLDTSKVADKLKSFEGLNNNVKNLSTKVDDINRKVVQYGYTSKNNSQKITQNIEELRKYIHEYADYNKKVYKVKDEDHKWFGKKQGPTSTLSPRSKRVEEEKEAARKKMEEEREKQRQKEEQEREQQREQQRRKEQAEREARERRQREQEEMRRKAEEERARQRKAEEQQKAKVTKELGANVKMILNFYNIESTNYVTSGKSIDRKFILLKFHPDKLPSNIKDLTKLDPTLSSFVSHVFDKLKTAVEEKGFLTMADVNRVVASVKIGGRRKYVNK